MAKGLVTFAPLIAGMPLVKRSPLVRLLGAAGAATALVKVAEAIREWDPAPEASGRVPEPPTPDR